MNQFFRSRLFAIIVVLAIVLVVAGWLGYVGDMLTRTRAAWTNTKQVDVKDVHVYVYESRNAAGGESTTVYGGEDGKFWSQPYNAEVDKGVFARFIEGNGHTIGVLRLDDGKNVLVAVGNGPEEVKVAFHEELKKHK